MRGSLSPRAFPAKPNQSKRYSEMNVNFWKPRKEKWDLELGLLGAHCRWRSEEEGREQVMGTFKRTASRRSCLECCPEWE